MVLWWVLALAACVVLYFAIWVRATKRGHRELSAEVSDEIAQRADQQNRWAQRGDARGGQRGKTSGGQRATRMTESAGTGLRVPGVRLHASHARDPARPGR